MNEQPESLWGKGCPVMTWDGPYNYRCGKGGDRGTCATHGEFAKPPAETETYRAEAGDLTAAAKVLRDCDNPDNPCTEEDCVFARFLAGRMVHVANLRHVDVNGDTKVLREVLVGIARGILRESAELNKHHPAVTA